MIMKKQYKRVLAACLAVSLLFSLAACRQTQEPPAASTQPTTETQLAAKVEHTVTVTGEDGTALEGVGVFVYTDSTYGVYPLTEDLAYMLRQGGDYKGWWKQDSGNYLFTDVENLNTENAWMFAVCWFE